MKKPKLPKANPYVILFDNWDGVYKWGVEIKVGSLLFKLEGHWYDDGDNKAPKECLAYAKEFNKAIKEIL